VSPVNNASGAASYGTRAIVVSPNPEMIESFNNQYPIDSEEDGNEIHVWEENSPLPSQELGNPPPMLSMPASHWSAANFRPGTAPEITVFNGERRTISCHGKDLSSPPTTLSETNFALKMAARVSRSRPSSGTRELAEFKSLSKKRAAGEKRSSARSPGQSKPPSSPYLSSSEHTVYQADSSGGFSSNQLSTNKPGPRTSSNQHVTRSQPARSQRPLSREVKECGPSPGTPPRTPQTKQRKAVSARVSRQPVRSHAVFGDMEDGEDTSPDAVFRRRREYPQRPPSRHREPGQSLGLDVHPEPARLRLRSAHFPSHHERPPSRCKPPNQALHLEDRDREKASHEPENAGVKSSGTLGWAVNFSAEDKEPSDSPPVVSADTAVQETSDASRETLKVKADDDGDRDCLVPSAEDNKRREWSAGLQRPAAPSTKHKPTGQPHIAQVPFRTSLSPDFLRLFAPANANAPPTPPHPTVQVGLAYNNNQNLWKDNQFSDCFSMGMADIPSPDDDPFMNQHFEDLCISEDESDSD